jgi:hypothetical protein
LTNLPKDVNFVLSVFGAQLNASSTVKGLQSNWQRYFKEQWMDFAHLTILSFHKSNGNRINNTTVAGSPEVLLPIIDGAANTCRQQDLKFVHMQCSMDFAMLVTINLYPASMVMRATYYIKLPQGTHGLINRNNPLYNLVLFLGVTNL